MVRCFVLIAEGKMANLLTSSPLVLDTDTAGFNAAQTLNPTGQGAVGGMRIYKFNLIVGAASASAGTVTVTDPVSSNNRLTPMPVPAGAAAGSVLYSEEVPTPILVNDFAVTGLTATGTKLYLWVK